MSRIQNFWKERERTQSGSRSIDYKEKIRSHKLTLFYRAVLCILLIVAVAAFLLVQWRDKVFTENVTTSSVPVTVVQGAEVKDLGGSLLLYSKDGASCIDTKGNAIWNLTYEMQSPRISISGETAAIGDFAS